MKKLVFQFVTFCLLTVCWPKALPAAEPPEVGDKAPDFSLKTLDNQTVRLTVRVIKALTPVTT